MLCEMAGRKRKLDEWDVSEMEESEGATIHGVFTELSPVKVSRRNASVRYYDGRMADGQKSARFLNSGLRGTSSSISHSSLRQSRFPFLSGFGSATLSLAFSSTAQPCFSSLLGVHVATLRQVDL